MEKNTPALRLSTSQLTDIIEKKRKSNHAAYRQRGTQIERQPTIEELLQDLKEDLIPASIHLGEHTQISSLCPASTLQQLGVEFLESPTAEDLLQMGFSEFPFILFSKELPLTTKQFPDWLVAKIEKATKKPNCPYDVSYHEKNACVTLKQVDQIRASTRWELEESLDQWRADLLYDCATELQRINDEEHLELYNLFRRWLSYHFTSWTRSLVDPLQEAFVSQLRPNLVAGPFAYRERDRQVVSLFDTPALVEIAQFLSTLKQVPGTSEHPLPFIVGEIDRKLPNTSDREAVLAEMAVVRSMHEAVFKQAPPFNFSIHKHRSYWRVFAMTRHSTTRRLYAIEVLCVSNERLLDRLHFGNVMYRITTYLHHQYQRLELASEEQRARLLEVCGVRVKESLNNIVIACGARLTEIRHVGRSYYRAKYRDVNCIVKVRELANIENELHMYNQLQGSMYMAELLGARKLNKTLGCLIVRRYGRVPDPESAAELIQIMKQLLTLLVEIHDRGLVHCDINFRSVEWDTSCQLIKLARFGTFVAAPKGAWFKTSIDYSDYQAPEVQDFMYWCDQTVDVYSVGLMCASMLYRRDINSEEIHEVIIQAIFQCYELPVPPPAFTTALFPLLQRMLAEDPTDRISAREALAVLDAVAEDHLI